MATKQRKKVDVRHTIPVQTGAINTYQAVLSVCAQINSVGRWIASHLVELQDAGGEEAANDCFASSDVLLEFLKEWRDQLVDSDMQLPPGIGYIIKSDSTSTQRGQSETQH